METRSKYLDPNYIQKLCDFSYNGVLKKIDAGINSFKGGEVLMQESPLLCALHPQGLKDRCDHCLAMVKMNGYGCEYCGKVNYCSNYCKNEETYFHKLECGQKEVTQRSAVTRMIIKLYYLIIKTNHPLEYFFPIDKCLSLKDDFAAVNTIHLTPIPFRKVNEELSNFKSDDFFLSTGTALYFYNLVVKRCFGFAENGVEFGVALYKLASNMKHSCDPNVHIMAIDSVIYLRLLKDITNLDKQELSMSYVDCLLPYDRRSEVLASRYCIKCDCPRCSNNDLIQREMSFLCPSCNSYIPYNLKVEREDQSVLERPSCPHCKLIPPEEVFSEFLALLKTLEHGVELEESVRGYRLLKKIKKLFHPVNVHFLNFVETHIDECKGADDFFYFANALCEGAMYYFPYENLTTLKYASKFYSTAAKNNWLKDPRFKGLSIESCIKRMFTNLSNKDFDVNLKKKMNSRNYLGMRV